MILAAGFGTRVSEESAVRPKPMVEIGGRPILRHIKASYLAHGLNDFVVCCGYKAHQIKQFFRDCALDYQVSAFYAPAFERGARHDDPAFGIDWPVPVLDRSDKDRRWPAFVREGVPA